MDASQVRPAAFHEQSAALRLLLQHRPTPEREARVFGILDLFRTGELDPEGLRVTPDCRGAILATRLAGAGGLIWPPVCLDSHQATALIESAVVWLRSQGVRLVQAFMHRPRAEVSALLEANGFSSVTDLVTLARDLDEPIPEVSVPSLHYEPYNPNKPQPFEETIASTYVDSFDCPEVNGLRTIAEVIAGHQAQGVYDPANWWLVRRDQHPVGVVVQVDHPLSEEREIGYIGLIPSVRGSGIAGAIMERILRQARAARLARVVLGVDARNTPAQKLYARWGFEEVDRQRVFLRLEL